MVNVNKMMWDVGWPCQEDQDVIRVGALICMLSAQPLGQTGLDVELSLAGDDLTSRGSVMKLQP